MLNWKILEVDATFSNWCRNQEHLHNLKEVNVSGLIPRVCRWVYATAQLLDTRIRPIYQVNEFIFFFLMLINEMRMLDDYKFLSPLLLILIKGMRTCHKSKISFCNLRAGKLLMKLRTSGVKCL